ncbi:MAG: PAS domain-containing protein [Alphaproteobacteria bacterium]|nr:PAS domain-containing protein [Alphaproteobacteria bacterium]
MKDSIAALMAGHGESLYPLFIWDDVRERFVYANPAAVTFFQEGSARDLQRRLLAPEDPFRLVLSAAASKLRPHGIVTESFVQPVEGQPQRVTAEIARRPLTLERSVLVVRVVATEALEIMPWRIQSAFEAGTRPTALFTQEGTPAQANAAFRRDFGDGAGAALSALFSSPYEAAAFISEAMALGLASRHMRLQTLHGPRRHRIIAKRLAEAGRALLLVELDDVEDEAVFDCPPFAAESAVAQKVSPSNDLAEGLENLNPIEAAAPLTPYAQEADAPTALPLEDLIEAMPDAVLLIDAGGLIFSANSAAREMLGADPAGEAIASRIDPALGSDLADFLSGLSTGGLGRALSLGRETHIQGAGERIPAYVTFRAVPSSPGTFCACVRDLRPQLAALHSIRAERDEALGSLARKTGFLSNITHELRTPLNAIIGFAEVMRDERYGPLGDARYRAYAGDIHASGALLLSLVNELLDLARAEAGRLDLTFESVDIAEAAHQAARMIAPLATRENVALIVTAGEDLPRVVADRRSITQILLNILGNAVKFAGNGAEITLAAGLLSDGGLRVAVSDTGPGMTEEQMALALEPFGRAKSVANRQKEGTGLGLPLAKALAEANRASFTIRSAPGRGTSVEIVFPSPLVLSE